MRQKKNNNEWPILRTDRENKDEDIEWIGLALLATWDIHIYISMPSRCQHNKKRTDTDDVQRRKKNFLTSIEGNDLLKQNNVDSMKKKK